MTFHGEQRNEVDLVSDGNVFRGEFKDGKRNGHGTMTFPDGRVFEGEWKDGKFNAL